MSAKKKLCIFCFFLVMFAVCKAGSAGKDGAPVNKGAKKDKVIIGYKGCKDETVKEGRIARDCLENSVLTLFYKSDFVALETMADEFRRNKARFPEGAWKLPFFYDTFSSPAIVSDEGWDHMIKKLNEWRHRYPDSMTPKVALAVAWKSYGWYARGSGYASTVSEKGWKLLNERLEKGYESLKDKPANPSADCPERYSMLLDYARAMGWDKEQFDALFREAVAFAPGYYDYYAAKTIYLLPRWHGDKGDWQRFADEAVTLTPPAEGMTIYARIFWAAWAYGAFGTIEEAGVPWEKVKQGFIDIERNYPDSSWNLNMFCRFACLAEDKETAGELFKKIGGSPYVEAWDGIANFEKCRRWAGI